MTQHDERLQRALDSLIGLSVGDAFGGYFEFSHPENLYNYYKDRRTPSGPLEWTDDTHMAMSIYDVLRRKQTIDPDELAAVFARRFDPARGYGPGARTTLTRIREGDDWREAASSLFEGAGSHGNGAAMRAAPVGAYFADDMNAVVEQARLSSEVTHTHPEGVAGAIAVAVGAAVAWNFKQSGRAADVNAYMAEVIEHIPESEVKANCIKTKKLSEDAGVHDAALLVGHGDNVSAQDTAPYALWCAGKYLDNYVEAMWQTVSGGGDMDTTCAIVGGVTAVYNGRIAIPQQWIESREPLPLWAFEDVDES